MKEKTYEDLKYDFDCIADMISEAIAGSNYYKAACISKFLSNALYTLNYTYRMDVLEENICKIGKGCVGSIDINKPDENRVLFYDGFGLFNRGIATIYIDALLKIGYDVTWIIYGAMPEIHEIINKYQGKVCFRYIPCRYVNIMDRIIMLADFIKEEKPKHLFLYTYPDDVVGVSVFSVIKGNAIRYLINLTDHAFWIGRDAVDLVIEFRDFGANISVKNRGVRKDEIRMLPFYPAKRSQYSYEGMPFPEDREYFFSGGTLYKVKGSGIFFEMVRDILNKYEELYFVYAGKDSCKDEDFIKLKKDYFGRVYLIEERRDLDEVMKHAKFYLNTFPVGGGLMTQYALLNNCLPLCLYEDEDSNPKQMLLHPEDVDFGFESQQDLIDYVDFIMKSNIKKNLSKHVITKDQFINRLSNIIKNNSSTEYVDFEINIDMIRKKYRNNYTYFNYLNMVKKSGNPWIIEKYKNDLKEYRINM